jgi:multidrug transporter EmrE-like cation transporter
MTKQHALREIARNWPIMGIAVVLWLAVVILRTPTIGIDLSRAFAIVISSGAMIIVGIQIERIRRCHAQPEDKEEPK